MLDFRELPRNGIAFEQMVRDIAVSLGYRAIWSGGGGADAGRDLLLDEPGHELLGHKVRRWLVSCKHLAHGSGGKGRPVGVNDLDGEASIKDSCAQHGAEGFLLACSTAPSAAVVARLEKVGAPGNPHTHYWDGVQIERMLRSPRQWAIAQQFLPVSADATGWKIWGTDRPNHFIGSTRGFYLHLFNRHMSALGYQLDSIDERLDAMGAIALPRGHELRMRAMWCDDKRGSFMWYVDYLYEDGDPVYSADELADRLGDNEVVYSDGQVDAWDVELHRVDRQSDSWHPDHYRFYDPYVGQYSWGGRRRERW